MSARQTLRCGLLVLAGICALPVWAESDVAGSRDPDGMTRFDGSWIVQYAAPRPTDHALILGALKKIDGAMQADRQERMHGVLTRVTYRVPEDYSLKAVIEHWQGELLGADRDLLFQCQGRACGSSNYWANRVFGIAELYGPDGEQYYEVTREAGEQEHRIHVLYVIRRGNRRIYAHVEDFRIPAEVGQRISPDPRTIVSLLKRERRLLLRDVRFAEGNDTPIVSEASLKLWASALSGEPVLSVAVVAHAYSAPSAEGNMSLSRRRANRLLDLLKKHVTAPQRLSAHGVGSLAPLGRSHNPGDRIELVLP